MTIITRLRKGKNSIGTVYIEVRHKNGVFKHNTGIRVLQKHFKEGRVRYDPESNAHNYRIEQIKKRIQKASNEAEEKGSAISNSYLREALSTKTNQKDAGFLIPFVESFIAQSRNRINPNTGRLLMGRTIGNMINAKDRLLEYESRHKITLRFEDINQEFYDAFLKDLQAKGYAKNTIGKFIRRIKEFMNAANDQGYTEWKGHKSKDFKELTEEIPNIYLTEAELEKLWHTNGLTKSERKARDLFIVGCYTGLRVSDFKELASADVLQDTIKIRTQKTDEYVVIPIHPFVQQVLDLYDGHFPKLSQQKLNEYIKIACQKAEIDDPVVIHRTEGGKKVAHKMKKFEAVSSHTARRSFATNLYLQGFPHLDIMRITGHRTEKAFLSYIKITKEQSAERLRQHWNKTHYYEQS